MKVNKYVIALALFFGVSAQASYIATPYSVSIGGTGTTTSTGTGSVVLNTSPTFVTPILGTPTSATLTNATGLPISTGVSGLGSGIATFLGTPSSANLNAAVTDATGTGALVFANSPTLITPALGTPASGVATNLTGTATALNIGGNAATATVLQTARTINGVSFNGSANINIPTGSMAVVDGGDAPYTISTEYTRDTTTLTAQRAYTLPACTAGNIGEEHYIKNLPAQTFNIVLTSAGIDNIDGSPTQLIPPGNSVHVVCGAFSVSGTWDLN